MEQGVFECLRDVEGPTVAWWLHGRREENWLPKSDSALLTRVLGEGEGKSEGLWVCLLCLSEPQVCLGASPRRLALTLLPEEMPSQDSPHHRLGWGWQQGPEGGIGPPPCRAPSLSKSKHVSLGQEEGFRRYRSQQAAGLQDKQPPGSQESSLPQFEWDGVWAGPGTSSWVLLCHDLGSWQGG